MRESTSLIAILFRLIGIGYWCWAGMHLVVWLVLPLAARMDPWGTQVFDPQRLVAIVGCTAVGTAVYAASIPLALRVTPPPASSRPFSFAFITLRIVGFCSFLFAAVWIGFALFELLVRSMTEHWPGQVHLDPRWRLRLAFTSAAPFLVGGAIWFLAPHLARLLTQRLLAGKGT